MTRNASNQDKKEENTHTVPFRVPNNLGVISVCLWSSVGNRMTAGSPSPLLHHL